MTTMLSFFVDLVFSRSALHANVPRKIDDVPQNTLCHSIDWYCGKALSRYKKKVWIFEEQKTGSSNLKKLMITFTKERYRRVKPMAMEERGLLIRELPSDNPGQPKKSRGMWAICKEGVYIDFDANVGRTDLWWDIRVYCRKSSILRMIDCVRWEVYAWRARGLGAYWLLVFVDSVHIKVSW